MLFELDNDNSKVITSFVTECADELSPRPDNSTIVNKAEGCELVLAGQLCIFAGHLWGDAVKDELKGIIDSRGAASAVDTGLRYLVAQGYERERLEEIVRRLSKHLEGLRPMIFQLLEGV
jgi:hypothetical protein